MIYIGIDPSLTGTGIVALDEEANILEQQLIKTAPLHPIEDRLKQILHAVENVINKNPPKNGDWYFCMEGLSFGSKGSSMLELAGLHYLLRCHLIDYIDSQLRIVAPTTLKKFVYKGTAKKEQMLLKTYKRWGVEFEDNNICDAYCLARYAMSIKYVLKQ